jgi:hypothetical protein
MECQQRQAGYGEFLEFRVGIDCSRRLPFEFQPLALAQRNSRAVVSEFRR